MLETIYLVALIPTTILLVVVLSQYIIITRPKPKAKEPFSLPVTVIIPAYNEEKYIENTVKSVVDAEYDSDKQIIVINDGSSDNTGSILKRLQRQYPEVTALETNHIGKSRAMNEALKIARNDVVVVIDADSELEVQSLRNLVRPLKEDGVAAVGGIVKVKNHKKSPITWFQRLEYLYASFFNSLCDRINGNIFTPGPISAFRKSVVDIEKGFNTKIYLEDVDMALRVIKRGYKIRIAEDAIVRTNVPETVKKWSKQRKRWMKGGIEVIKNHKDIMFKRRFGASGFYPLPLLTYWYFHSIVMGIVIFSQVFIGYYTWFVLNGAGISIPALQYFLYWFSALGIFNLIYMIGMGMLPATPLLIMSISLTLLSYPLYIYPYFRFKEKFMWRDALALFFIFPYWIMVLIIQARSNVNWLRTGIGRNWWTK